MDDDEVLTRAGHAARARRAAMLKGDPQARADLNQRWAAAARHDSTGVITLAESEREAMRDADRR